MQLKCLLDGVPSKLSVDHTGRFVDAVIRDELEKKHHKFKTFTADVAEETKRAGGLMLFDRLVAFKATVSFNVAVLVLNISDTEYDVVLWAYTLSRMYNVVQREVCLDDFTRFFPKGIPDRAEKDRIWGLQKVGGTDLLRI